MLLNSTRYATIISTDVPGVRSDLEAPLWAPIVIVRYALRPQIAFVADIFYPYLR